MRQKVGMAGGSLWISTGSIEGKAYGRICYLIILDEGEFRCADGSVYQ